MAFSLLIQPLIRGPLHKACVAQTGLWDVKGDVSALVLNSSLNQDHCDIHLLWYFGGGDAAADAD